MTPRFPFLSLACAFLFTEVCWADPLTRVANDTLRLPKELPAGSFKTENAFPELRFNRPVGMVTPPGETQQLFVLEQVGLISVIPNLDEPTKETFLDLSDVVVPQGESGLLGLAFHPEYAENGQFFVFYSTRVGNQLVQRVSRFERHALAPLRAVKNSEQPLIDQVDQAGNHNGGDLHFGPDGYLYISFGDEGGANDQYDNSRFLDRDFFSGIARIDVDRRPGSVPPNPHEGVYTDTYAIPPDNPFLGITTFMGAPVEADSVRSEFWAVGLRNPWRMSFDYTTGRLFCADVGQGAREEINLIEKGGHYGWSFREGSRTFRSGPGRSDEPSDWTPREPIWDYGRSEGISVTGGVVYRGLDHPELYEAYVFGDYGSGAIWALHFEDNDQVRVDQIGEEGSNEISAFGVDPRNGEVLYAAHRSGQIKRIARRSRGFTILIPRTLSQTGAFADLETLTPEAGIVAYAPNVSFWSDGAVKRRWFSVPAMEDTIAFREDGPWAFPEGTTWIKHFDLELEPGNPESRRRLETRFLVKTETGSYGLSYAWNEEQTDAEVVSAEGETRDYVIETPEGPRTQRWSFPSRNACRACHTREAGHALSFHTPQLNRDFDYGETSANQLRALADAGYFSEDVAKAPEELARLVSPSDSQASLEDRARAYLDTNCAQCHRGTGGALGTWDARAALPLSQAGLIDGALVNHFGDASMKVIAPGHPERSMVLRRLTGEGGVNRMPPLGSNVVDEAGLGLLRQWVASLGSDGGGEDYESWMEALGAGLSEEDREPGSDPDRDGVINEQEFRAGTDPTRGDHVWRAAVVKADGNEGPVLRLPTVANGVVVTEWSRDARQWEAWTPEPDGQRTLEDGTLELRLNEEEARQFFRFRLEPRPDSNE